LAILVLNAGSSSLKFALFDDDAGKASSSGEVDWKGQGKPASLTLREGDGPGREQDCDASDPASAARLAIEAVGDPSAIKAVGHRVVHGGLKFRESIRIDDSIEADLDHLAELAPLHNPPAIAGIDAAKRALPGVPQFAAFDTSFFANLPRSVATYAIPHAWTDDWGIRKFGFHGISHSYCLGRAGEILGRDPKALRLIVCHLGNGCSASAIRGGVAIDTTMGYTPVDGLMMGTRSGTVDPGVLTHVIGHRGLSADQVDRALNHESGLLGVSGVSGDYRKVEEAAGSGDERAKLALEIYAGRVRSTIGAFAATLGGLDALVFAAGVGEHSATLRAAACEGLDFLGVRLDPTKNQAQPKDADIAPAGSPARVLVIHTEEELMIAREVSRLSAVH